MNKQEDDHIFLIFFHPCCATVWIMV